MRAIAHTARLVFPFVLAAPMLMAISCGDDDLETPAPDNAEEVITTLNLTFTPQGGGAPVTAQLRDADGPGGDDPTQTGITLAPGTTYDLTLELLNETVPTSDPEYRIIDEIKEECEEHLFFFTGTAISGGLLTQAYADKESDYAENAVGDDLPVGIASTITTAGSGTGTFIVTLKHMPELNGALVKTADATINDGDTDLEVTFELTLR